MILIIRNIDRSVSQSTLFSLVAKYGRIAACDLVMDEKTGQSKGFAFVEMTSEKDANTAIRELNKRRVGKEELRVKKAAASSIRKFRQ